MFLTRKMVNYLKKTLICRLESCRPQYQYRVKRILEKISALSNCQPILFVLYRRLYNILFSVLYFHTKPSAIGITDSALLAIAYTLFGDSNSMPENDTIEKNTTMIILFFIWKILLIINFKSDKRFCNF